ncbi:DUF3237 domain-containing protein [Pseudomonas putida]|uniref:Uncharacterized protein n=1 Tax=Pseudomonas putida TaxID=303 RepID=A0A1Q9R5E0_PSEPU|nr:DUF3237 domain-containing protein [Pseudomonas putida]OLS62565.1 hypothetical protein PSEMO_25150 [Pseudomonas putida]
MKTTTHTLLVTALGLLVGVVQAGELKDSKPDRVKTELVMQINVKLGADEDMGKGAEGHRINYPIIGGHFVASGFKGEVIPGGADMSVERNDGVTKIDALYRLKTEDGQVIIIHNYGLWRPTAAGLAKQAKGEELTQADFYCRTVPSFSTPAGKYDWLEDYTYVGTIDDVNDKEVLIGVYRVDGV